MIRKGWRYVEDGAIASGVHMELPTSWRDKGDLSGWGDEQLAEEGWLPNYVDDQRVPGEVDAPTTDELLADRVVQTLHSRARTADDLAAERAAMWEQIKAIRDRKSDEGGYTVTVGGEPKWFHSDPKSKTQQLALVMAGASIPAVPWKTMDGSFVTMSQSLAAAIYQAAMAQDMAIFAHAETLRAEVNAAENPGSVDITAGWPATYGGA